MLAVLDPRSKLNSPLALVRVRPTSSMPLARRRRITSSPPAGVLVVPLVATPRKVSPAAVSEQAARRKKMLKRLNKVDSFKLGQTRVGRSRPEYAQLQLPYSGASGRSRLE